MVVDVGDGWLVMVGGVDGVWLVEVTGMSHLFFFSSYFLFYAATTFKTFSALFFYIFR